MLNKLIDYSPESLCSVINDEWNLGIHPEDIQDPPMQGRSSHVVLVKNMAIKFKVSHSSLKWEESILRYLEDKELPIDTPTIIYTSSNRAMMAMTALPGAPMHQFGSPVVNEEGIADDSIIINLARFTVELDSVMENTSITCKLSDGLPNFIKATNASDTVKDFFRRSKHPERIMHNDFNSGNIIIQPPNYLGIIDFEALARCDPHFQVVSMMSYYGFGPKGCAKFVEAVNGLSKSGKWLDMDRVIELTEAYQKLVTFPLPQPIAKPAFPLGNNN